MATSKTKLTKEQLSEAVDALAKWFPEDGANLSANRDEIVSLISNNTEPAPGSALALVQGEKKARALPETVAQAKLVSLSLTPCQEACGAVAVDVIFFAFGLLGLHVSNQERIARAVIRELGGDTLRGLARAIRNFNTAEGAVNKAKALFTLMGQIYNAGGFKAAFKALKDEMSWWDWTKTGLIAVAQLTAWFATDGVAFIAEAALSIMSAEQLIEDAVKAVKACSSD